MPVVPLDAPCHGNAGGHSSSRKDQTAPRASCTKASTDVLGLQAERPCRRHFRTSFSTAPCMCHVGGSGSYGCRVGDVPARRDPSEA